LNIVTRAEYDDQGRVGKMTDPKGMATYTLYGNNQTLVGASADAAASSVGGGMCGARTRRSLELGMVPERRDILVATPILID
jgi:hypothetical protein